VRGRTRRIWVLATVLGLSGAGAVTNLHNQPAWAAPQLYYVAEMLAALLLFFVGFACVTVVIVILLMLDRALYLVLAWAGPCPGHEAPLKWGSVKAGQLDAKQFHRSAGACDGA
jgi:hypothetical protein